MDEFNEAKLRGIDMRKLRRESFTSREHLSMVAEHEMRSAVEREHRRYLFHDWTGDTPKIQPKVEKTEKRAKNIPTKYRFTPEQLRIALAVANNEKETKNGGR